MAAINPYAPPTDRASEIEPIQGGESQANWVVVVFSALMFGPIILGIVIGLVANIAPFLSRPNCSAKH